MKKPRSREDVLAELDRIDKAAAEKAEALGFAAEARYRVQVAAVNAARDASAKLDKALDALAKFHAKDAATRSRLLRELLRSSPHRPIIEEAFAWIAREEAKIPAAPAVTPWDPGTLRRKALRVARQRVAEVARDSGPSPNGAMVRCRAILATVDRLAPAPVPA